MRRTAIVTGAARGIGAAVAARLARDDCQLVLTDIDADELEKTAMALRREGHDVTTHAGDIGADEMPEALVGAAIDVFGGIDVIVNNAGYIWPAAIHKMTDEQFDTLQLVHVRAPFRLLRAAAAPMLEAVRAEQAAGDIRHRKVVNISSLLALRGAAMSVNYGAAKAAVIGLTRSLAAEWGRYAINVNCVAFGMIATRFTDPKVAADPELRIGDRTVNIGRMAENIADIEPTIPLRRVGRVDEAAGAIAFFCGADSDYVTGQVLTVSGGL